MLLKRTFSKIIFFISQISITNFVDEYLLLEVVVLIKRSIFFGKTSILLSKTTFLIFLLSLISVYRFFARFKDFKWSKYYC